MGVEAFKQPSNYGVQKSKAMNLTTDNVHNKLTKLKTARTNHGQNQVPKLKTDQSTKNRHNQVMKVKKGPDNVDQRTQPGNETQNRPDSDQQRKLGKKNL